MWVKTPKSIWWLHIPLKRTHTHTHTQHSFALTLPWHNATEVPFAFTSSKIASHFQHDESAVTHAANGLSYDCLINKHRDPREHPWILITSQLRDGTDLHSVHFLPFWLITVKSNKTHVGQDLPADPRSFLVLWNCFWLLRGISCGIPAGKNAEPISWGEEKKKTHSSRSY